MNRQKILIMFFLLLYQFVKVSSVLAYDAIVDGIYYALFDTTATVTYCNYYNNGNAYKGSVTIPQSITYKGIDYTVTAVGYGAFHACAGLNSIILPNSITSIGDEAFSYCTGLSTIVIPDSVTKIGNNTFSGCSSLSNIAIPNSVISIGIEAFSDCSNLMTISIPNSVKNIGNEAFSGCINLSNINMPSSVTSIGRYAFSNTGIYKNCPDGLFMVGKWVCGYKGIMPPNTTISFPEGVLGVADAAFESYSTLAEIVIPNSVVTIGGGAFLSCSNLAAITIGNSVVNIGNGAFKDCVSLSRVNVPNSVAVIGNYAFSGCKKLISATVGNFVTSIGNNAFDGCSELKTIRVLVTDYSFFCNNTVVGLIKTQIAKPVILVNEDGDEIQDYSIPMGVKCIGKSAFQNCIGLKSVAIPYSVISIGDLAFWNCSNLLSVTIPSSITSISGSAFHNCYDLTIKVHVTDYSQFCNNQIVHLIVYNTGCPIHLIDEKGNEIEEYVIPEGTTSISDYAFQNCGYIKCVTIPSTIKSIGYESFVGCSSLKDVYCFAEEVPLTDKYAFNRSGAIFATLHVPQASIDTYKISKPWKDFSNIVRIKLPEHTLSYIVDGELYKAYQIEEGEFIEPESEPIKEGNTFSGWINIPEIMPAHDVTVSGFFSINKYQVTYIIDGVVFAMDYVEYGATIIPPAVEGKEGYSFSGWYDVPEIMPAYDITIYGSFTSDISKNLLHNKKEPQIYTISGKRTNKLQHGVYIVKLPNGKTNKHIVK